MLGAAQLDQEQDVPTYGANLPTQAVTGLGNARFAISNG